MAERTGGLGELSKWRSSDLHCRIWLPLWELARCWIYRLAIDIATTRDEQGAGEAERDA